MFEFASATRLTTSVGTCVGVKVLMLDDVLFLTKAFAANLAAELLNSKVECVHMPLE